MSVINMHCRNYTSHRKHYVSKKLTSRLPMPMKGIKFGALHYCCELYIERDVNRDRQFKLLNSKI